MAKQKDDRRTIDADHHREFTFLLERAWKEQNTRRKKAVETSAQAAVGRRSQAKAVGS